MSLSALPAMVSPHDVPPHAAHMDQVSAAELERLVLALHSGLATLLAGRHGRLSANQTQAVQDLTHSCDAALAHLRNAPPASIVEYGTMHLDRMRRQASVQDRPLHLTRTEFDLLAALSVRPTVVLSRRQLIEAIRDDSWVGDDHLIDVHIGHLRRKLGDDAAQQRYIVTVRGVGYRMGTGQ